MTRPPARDARADRPANAAAVVGAALAGALLAVTGCAGGGGAGATSHPGGGAPQRSFADPADASTGTLVAQAALPPCPSSAASASGRPGGLPDITLPCLGNGPAVHLAGLPGPAVVNLWAPWCGACVAEVPVLSALSARTAGRLTVLGVVTQDDRRDALSGAHGLGSHVASVWDQPGRLLSALALAGLPGTVLVDRSGLVSHVVPGPLPTDRAALDALVARYTGVTP